MSRHNGVVHLELAKVQRTEKGELWRAHLHLVEGHVAACHVQSQVDGRRLLSDSEAMRWLARWGQREFVWSLEIFTLHQTAPHPAPAGLLPPARSVAPPQQVSQLAALPSPARHGFPPHHVAPSAGFLPPATQMTGPQRSVQVEQGVISSWPRKYRQVFALVDGKRSVGQIAALLKLPPTVVEKIVNELQSMGIIQIR